MSVEIEGKIKNSTYSFEKQYADYYPMPRFMHVGRVETTNGWSHEEHLHVSYEWIYVIDGTLRFWCNGESFVIKGGDFHYIQPGQTHKEESITKKLDFIYIKFFLLDLNGGIEYFIPPPGIPEQQVIRELHTKIVALINEIYEEGIRKEVGSQQIIEAILLKITWLLRRELKIEALHPNDRIGYRAEIVKKATDYIKDNTHKNLSISQIAAHCNISSDYLAHIFKDMTGISTLQYVLRTKIDEAKVMLDKGELTISQIAETLSFTDSFYFSRVFKKITGVSPSRFKRVDKS